MANQTLLMMMLALLLLSANVSADVLGLNYTIPEGVIESVVVESGDYKDLNYQVLDMKVSNVTVQRNVTRTVERYVNGSLWNETQIIPVNEQQVVVTQAVRLTGKRYQVDEVIPYERFDYAFWRQYVDDWERNHSNDTLSVVELPVSVAEEPWHVRLWGDVKDWVSTLVFPSWFVYAVGGIVVYMLAITILFLHYRREEKLDEHSAETVARRMLAAGYDEQLVERAYWKAKEQEGK